MTKFTVYLHSTLFKDGQVYLLSSNYAVHIKM